MKGLKSIGQVLAAVAYSCLYTGLIYLITVFPIAWLMSFDTKVIVLIVIFLGGLIQFLIFGLQALLTMPYYWIVKNNIVALIISIGLIVFNLVRSDVLLWQNVSGQGRTAIVVGVIITLLLLEALWASIYGVIMAYAQGEE